MLRENIDNTFNKPYEIFSFSQTKIYTHETRRVSCTINKKEYIDKFNSVFASNISIIFVKLFQIHWFISWSIRRLNIIFHYIMSYSDL